MTNFKSNPLKKILLAAALTTTAACAQTTEDPSDYQIKGSQTKSDSSVEAVFVELAFDGELITNNNWNPRSAIDDQLLYTIGHLNGHDSNGVGRLDKVEISNVQTEHLDNGMTRVTYHAVLPAAWGHPDRVPQTHTLRLPKDISFSGQEAFTNKYKDNCVDRFAHDVDSGIMWYYYRPLAYGCSISDDDVVTLTADVSMSSTNTTGKYPEYDKVWEDDTLNVVAIFGKNEENATSNDAGISAYNSFTRAVKRQLEPFNLVTSPELVPYSPGNDMPDTTYYGTFPDGKKVVVTALLIDGVRVAGHEFDQRYESLTGNADFISYAGHSGLGANIRALARKGSWESGQYTIVYMGGCDTYAYVDSALAEARSAVNLDDPTGTKYMDMITNAQPAFFHENPNTVMQFLDGLMSYDDPKTFDQMFAKVDDFQVILVSGEEDNVFTPGGNGGDIVTDWQGLEDAGEVVANQSYRYEVPGEGKQLAAGTYVFEIEGTNDADLYVKIGSEPTEYSYDCRPYLGGSHERCEVELSSPATIHVMVQGYASHSDFRLVGSMK
jgi:hypothetical protein